MDERLYLSLSDIRAAHVLEVEKKFDAGKLLGAPPAMVSFNHAVTAKVTAKMTEPTVLVVGQVDTTVTQICGRCLEKFDKRITGAFQQIFNLDLDEIDVTQDVRETVLIDLPIRPVCKDNCRGLCPVCGINRNNATCRCAEEKTDPRWSKLKELGS